MNYRQFNPVGYCLQRNPTVSAREVPDAWGYVLAEDTFMSGWGPAEGKKNIVVFPVRNAREADVVLANVRSRSEMRRVRLVRDPPASDPTQLLSLMSPKRSAAWYRPGMGRD